MKKLILAAFAVTCAASVFAQGTVAFNTRLVGTVIQHVYAPLASNVELSKIGNGAIDFPVGATDWTGYNLIGIGGLTGPYGGNTTFAQLIGAPGSGVAESSLVPASPTTVFRTAAAIAGTVTATTSAFANVLPDSAATVQMVAWDNSSGLYPTWTQAKAAWELGTIAAGKSATWNTVLGGTGTPPNVQAQSFNLYFQVIPEPSSFALAGLGLAALLAFRRRS